MRDWQEIAERLKTAGWTWGCTQRVDSGGKTIFIADAYNADGKRFAVRSDDRLLAFLELERQIWAEPAPSSPPASPAVLSPPPAIAATNAPRPRKQLPLSIAVAAIVVIVPWAIALYFRASAPSHQPGASAMRIANPPMPALPTKAALPTPSNQGRRADAAEAAKRAEEIDRVMEGIIQDSLVKPVRLTPEEKALLDKGQIFEMAGGQRAHSGHMIMRLKVGDSKTEAPSVCFLFGIEDIGPARKEGESMAQFQYSRDQAEQFLFAEGWEKYHNRFFTRCYVQEGLNAYEKALTSR